MDPIDTIDYGVQTIVENQRADALPILPGQTDMHYFKKHLLGTDPSPWTFASTGASCTPSTVPLPEVRCYFFVYNLAYFVVLIGTSCFEAVGL